MTHLRLARFIPMLFLLLASCSSGSPSHNTGTGGGAGSGAGGTATGTGGGGGSAAGGSGGSGPSCPQGRTLCAGECVDTTGNPYHCGACGKACGTNQVCNNSVCQTAPDCRSTPCPGFSYCDLASGHCNPGCAFDTQCVAGETCDLTTHACVCPSDTHRCSGVCVDGKSVGSCGASCAICATDPNGATACDGTACSLTCNSGYKMCSGTCALCPTANVAATDCSGTACVVTSCATGYHLCSGSCVSSTSIMSCGTSCTACPTSANGTTTCDGTTCAITCASGYKLCNGTCALCPTANVAATACSGTTCVVTTCASGYHLCSGACTSNTSVMSCGTTSCTPCPTTANGTATCNSGTCGLGCNVGYQLCNNACALCPTNAAATSCSGTQCMATSCASGTHLCAGMCPSTTSVQACGTSCTPCPAVAAASGTESCNGTMCVSTCNTGYVVCNTGCCLPCQSSPSVCTGTDWCQPTTQICQSVQKLQPVVTDAMDNDTFGISVALSGTLALVGNPSDDGGIGSADIFERQPSGVWTLQGTKLRPDLPLDGSAVGFGTSVSVSGETLVIGAPSEGGIGTVYLFERNTGVWGPAATQKWTGEGLTANDRFGYAVAFSGDRIVIGAMSASATDSGNAYILERQPNGSWPASATRLARPAGAGSNFGISVAISGDRALIGAPYGGTEAAYVFERQANGGWTSTAMLQAQTAISNVRSNFGVSVALEGNRALVGAPADDTGSRVNSGAVYVFGRTTSNNWAVSARLTQPAANAGAGDAFGYSVSLQGDRALIGASQENRSADPSGGIVMTGSIFLFQYLSTGSWDGGTELRTGSTDEIANRRFGYSVALAWPFALGGAYNDLAAAPSAGIRSGTAYVINAQSVVP